MKAYLTLNCSKIETAAQINNSGAKLITTATISKNQKENIELVAIAEERIQQITTRHLEKENNTVALIACNPIEKKYTEHIYRIIYEGNIDLTGYQYKDTLFEYLNTES